MIMSTGQGMNRNIEILNGNQYKALPSIWVIVVVVGVVVVIVVVLADVGNCKLKIGQDCIPVGCVPPAC